MAAVEVAKNRWEVLKRQFTRAETRLKDSLKLSLSLPLATIQRRFVDVKSKWTEVQDAHGLYLLKC